MTDHANELRRHARKIPYPQGETPGVMLRAADEIECLRAKITEMEKQEPAAFGLYSGWVLKVTYLKEHEACEQRDRRQLTADLAGSLEAYRVSPLYALPGAQPAPSVPEGWKLMPVEPTKEIYERFAAYDGSSYSNPFDFDDFREDYLAAINSTGLPVGAKLYALPGAKGEEK